MRILVLGAGISGLAAAGLASRRGDSVSVYDAQPERAASIIAGGIGALVGGWDTEYLRGVDLVVTSPGFPERSQPITDAHEAGIAVETEFEWAWKQMDASSTIGVTGTNGKTTVTSLIAEMLRASGITAAAMGNIGETVSDAVGSHHDVAVIEVSSAQLQMSESFHPDVAVVTNVEIDHLDWHGSEAAYRDAKAKIVRHQTAEDSVVYTSSDRGATTVALTSAGRKLGIDQFERADHGFGGDPEVVMIANIAVQRDRIAAPAGPFVQDLLLAAAAACEVGGDARSVAVTAMEFVPGAHRQRLVAEIAGVAYVDDSKATNPHAALAAIETYERVILIAGGQSKGLDIAQLARHPNVKALIAMGESAGVLRAAAPTISHTVTSMREAVKQAHQLASAGDVVLLSPGGASWDMFDSYAHRGEEFASIVNQIAERKTR